MRNMRKVMAVLVALMFSLSQVVFATIPTDNEETLGYNRGYVDSTGIVMESGYGLTLGGELKTSWGSVVSPMTDYSGYVAPTDAGSNLKLWDDGDITVGGGVATDIQYTFDGNAQDFYIALDDSADRLRIGYGSTVGTTMMLSLAASRNLYVGDATENDFNVVFDGYAQDYHIGIDDSGGAEEDLLVIGRGVAVGTTDDLAIGKASGTVYLNAIDTSGAADIDVGSADVTDVTITTDGGALILDGTITLTGAEVISNATDDTVRIASNDLDTVLEIYSPYATNGDARLLLTADADADAGDRMAIVNDGATNSMFFQSDTASADTLATILTLAKTGIVTTTSYIESKITDTSTNSVVDVLKLTHDGGTAAAGVGTGLVYQIDDSGGIEEQASIDVSLSAVTNGSEEADMLINLNTTGTMRNVLTIDNDTSATECTVFELNSWTIETNGVVDVMEITLDNTADTATDGFGAGISIIMEDETNAAEEQASIDFVLTDAGSTAEDCDVVISQNVAGTITERVRFDADGANILLSGATPSITIGDAGTEDTSVLFDGQAQDFHIGLDDTADDLVIGVGTALGTTTALAVDENTDITCSGNLVTEGCLDLGTVDTFTDEDATPDVSDGSYFITNTTTYTLTDFDGAGIVAGQIIAVESAGAITYDVTGQGLVGGSTDLVTADGDLTTWLYNGTDWLLIAFMDLSDDMT